MMNLFSYRWVRTRPVLLVSIVMLITATLAGCERPPASPSQADVGVPDETTESRTADGSPSPSLTAALATTEETAQLTPMASAQPAVQTTCVSAPETPSEITTPGRLAPSPTPPSPAELLRFALTEEVDMVPGQRMSLIGTDIEVTLVEAHGPSEGCSDCPNRAILEVKLGSKVQVLDYSFSGMMVPRLLERARRKPAFGYVFVAHRIAEGKLTLRVDPETE